MPLLFRRIAHSFDPSIRGNTPDAMTVVQITPGGHSVNHTLSARPVMGALLVLVLLALGACVPVPDSGNRVPDGIVRGEVTFPDLRPLPADASIVVEIVDPTIAGYPSNVLASTTMRAGNLRPPVPYQLAFDPAQVKPNVDYLIGARVLAGNDLLYVSQSGIFPFAADADRGALEIATDVRPAQAAVPGQLNGELTWLTRDLLPENAVIAVQLVDRTTQPYQRIAETTFRSDGVQTPIPFLIHYDPASIDPLRTYAIEARISIDGRLAWLTRQPVPALTQNSPGDNLEVALEKVASETAATEGNTVIANLVFPADDQLPIGSTVHVEIVDLSQDAVVASTDMPAEGLTSPIAVPITLNFTPSELRQFVLRARIFGSEEDLYIDEGDLPVLTQGAPVTNIAVPLVALHAPVVFATSAATPIAVPTAIAVSGDAPQPGIAPSFPGGASEPNAGATSEEDATVEEAAGEEDEAAAEEGDDAEAGDGEDGDASAEVPSTLEGTIGYVQRVALPAGAVISIQLLDLSSTPFQVVAEDRIVTEGEQPPFDFSLPLDDLGDELDAYAVAATITSEGEVLWSAPELTPLIFEGAPRAAVDLLVTPGTNGGVGLPDQTPVSRLERAAVTTPQPEGEADAEDETEPEAEATPEPSPTASIDTSAGNVVAVVVTFASSDVQGPGTQVRAELRDVTTSSIVAETQVDATRPGEAVGIALNFDPGAIVPTSEYRVFITVLQDGAPVAFTGRGTPVITNGAPVAIQIEMP